MRDSIWRLSLRTLSALGWLWFAVACKPAEDQKTHQKVSRGDTVVCAPQLVAVHNGKGYATEKRYDRAVEALAGALIACPNATFQSVHRPLLATTIASWREELRAAGNLDRVAFLSRALYQLTPTPQRELELFKSLLATHHFTPARSHLDHLLQTATPAQRITLLRHKEELERRIREASPKKLTKGETESFKRTLERALAELVLGYGDKAGAQLRPLGIQTRDQRVLYYLAESLLEASKPPKAKALLSQLLGALEEEGQKADRPQLAITNGQKMTSQWTDNDSYEGSSPMICFNDRIFSYPEPPDKCLDIVTGMVRPAKEPDITRPPYRYTISTKKTGEVVVKETGSGKQVRIIRAHKGIVAGNEQSYDGRYLATAGADGTVKLWSLPTGRRIKKLGTLSDMLSVGDCSGCGPAAYVGRKPFDNIWLHFADKARYLVAYSARGNFLEDNIQIMVWSIPTGRLIKNIKMVDKSTAFQVDPNGTYMVLGTRTGTLKLWSLATGKLLHELSSRTGCGCEGGHSVQHGPEMLEFDPGGRFIAAALRDRRVMVWELPSARLRKIYSANALKIRSLALDPRRNQMAAGTSMGRVTIWSTTTGKPMGTLSLSDFSTPIKSLTFDPKGRNFLVAAEHDITVWALPKMTLHKRIKTDHFSGGTESVTVDPQGRHMVSRGGELVSKVWKLPNGESLGSFKHKGSGGFHADALSANYLATGTALGTVIIRRAPKGSVVQTLGREASSKHSAAVVSLAIDSRERYVVSGSRDATAKVWDLTTGQPLHTLKGHKDDVKTVAMDAEARYVATGSKDKTVKLWDRATGRLLRTLTDHTSSVRVVMFDPQSRYLISGAEDGTLRFWSLPKGELLLTMVTTISGEWLVMTPDGYMDGSPLGMKYVRHSANQLLSRAVGQLRYHVPGLLHRALNQDHAYALTNLKRLLDHLEQPFDTTQNSR